VRLPGKEAVIKGRELKLYKRDEK
jgi:hypothetical protein